VKWEPIDTFDPATHRGTYLFAAYGNVILGHWYEGEDEPRMAYTGQEFPLSPEFWMPLPEPPGGE
jgi:hypothetical protein